MKTNLKINNEINEVNLVEWSDSVDLEGHQLKLKPLGLEHLNDLERNLLTPQAWHSIHWGTKTRNDLEKGILNSLQARDQKIGNSFAMIIKSTNEVVGMSRYMMFNRSNRGIEIGGTWIGEKWKKSFVNTEAKLLMLSYAFETLNCQRVEFRADAYNFNSQRAILRLGAKFEGELRNSCLLPDGRKRDYKLYSIIDSEWSNVKTTLHWYLDKYVST